MEKRKVHNKNISVPVSPETEIGGKVHVKELALDRLYVDSFSGFGLVEGINRISEDVGGEQTADFVTRWSEKVKGHYNSALNVDVKVEEKKNLRTFGVLDGVLLVDPDLKGAVRNEDFVLMHECVHEKQRLLMGFSSRAEMVAAYTEDFSASELGARDWVEKYSMPPFVMSADNQQTIFGFYNNRDLRASVAMGLRDIHSDVIAIRNRASIFLTESEKSRGVNPEGKFIEQIDDELRANAFELSPKNEGNIDAIKILSSRSPLYESDLIRKAARFNAVATGSAKVLDANGFNEVAQEFDAGMRHIYGEGSRQYTVYRALKQSYTDYFINCTNRSELIDPKQMLAALDSPQTVIRARSADFLGEVGDVKIVGTLGERCLREPDPFVKKILEHAMKRLLPSDFEKEDTWRIIDDNVGNQAVLTEMFQRLQRLKKVRLPDNAENTLINIADAGCKIDTLFSSYGDGAEAVASNLDKFSKLDSEVGLHLAQHLSKNDETRITGCLFPKIPSLFPTHPSQGLDIAISVSNNLTCPLTNPRYGGQKMPMEREAHKKVVDEIGGLYSSHPDKVLSVLGNIRRNHNPLVGRPAAVKLGHLSEDPVIKDTLLAGLTDAEPVIVCDTLYGIAECIDRCPQAIDDVAPKIDGIEYSNNPDVRVAAAKAIGRLAAHRPDNNPRISFLLNDSKKEVKIAAIHELVTLYPSQSELQTELEAIAQGKIEDRYALAQALSENRDLPPNSDTIFYKMLEVGEHGDAPEFKATSGERGMCFRAGYGLAHVFMRHSAKLYKKLLENIGAFPDGAKAGFAMGLLPIEDYTPQVTDALRVLSKDPDEGVREEVAGRPNTEVHRDDHNQFEQLQSERIKDDYVDLLLTMVDDPSDRVRAELAKTLRIVGRRRPEAIKPAVDALLQHGGERTLSELTSTWGDLLEARPTIEIDALSIISKDVDLYEAVQSVNHIIESATLAKNKGTIDKLKALRQEKRPYIRYCASKGLRGLGLESDEMALGSVEDVVKAPLFSNGPGPESDLFQIPDRNNICQSQGEYHLRHNAFYFKLRRDDVIKGLSQYYSIDPKKVMKLVEIGLNDTEDYSWTQQHLAGHTREAAVSALWEINRIDPTVDPVPETLKQLRDKRLDQVTGKRDLIFPKGYAERAANFLINHRSDNPNFLARIAEDPQIQEDARKTILKHLHKN